MTSCCVCVKETKSERTHLGIFVKQHSSLPPLEIILLQCPLAFSLFPWKCSKEVSGIKVGLLLSFRFHTLFNINALMCIKSITGFVGSQSALVIQLLYMPDSVDVLYFTILHHCPICLSGNNFPHPQQYQHEYVISNNSLL